MKPYRHARNSARKFGGRPEDYLDLHNFMDVSKSAYADVRHRAVLHNALGCYIAERVFGMPLEALDMAVAQFGWSDEEREVVIDLLRLAKTDAAPSILNSDGRRVQVRDVAEEHVKEDLGQIPSLGNWLDNMQIQRWMGGPVRRAKPLYQHDED